MILDGADAKVGEIVAERIRGFFDAEETFGTSMSIGVNQYDIGEGIEPFIKGTDEALYKAKSAGKNTICVV